MRVQQDTMLCSWISQGWSAQPKMNTLTVESLLDVKLGWMCVSRWFTVRHEEVGNSWKAYDMGMGDAREALLDWET